ncbi:MAG: M1 family metallopeptidase, partial [Thermoanaerobaculia bacterium]
MRLRASLLTTLVFVAVSLPAFAADPAQARADYDRLQKWQFSTLPVAITQPVTITRDTATITLTSGNVHLMQPVSSGRVTGLVFEGDGHFTMTIPDRIEVAQLKRFSKKDISSVDQKFTQLVLRMSDDTIDKLFPTGAKEPFAKNSVAENRHNHWLIDLGHDLDAGVVAAMLNPGALRMSAAMKTADFDWLTLDYDSTRREEIQLIHWKGNTEIWISLDRAEDRNANGGPGEGDVRPATISNLDVKADLSKGKWNSRRVGETEQAMLNGHYTLEEKITANVDGLVALPLELDPTAKELTATDDKGQPLAILRDHTGARSSGIGNEIYSYVFTLIFSSPLKAGESRAVTFHYDLETANYAFGNTWYPSVPEAFDKTTARLELKVGKHNEVRAMGKRVSETESPDGSKVSLWVVERPAKMVTFSTAEHFNEVPLEIPGVPKVISFGTVTGLDPGTRIRNAGADVINSIRFYQFLFDDKLDTPQIYATAIAAGHGQAFDGFLHLSEFAYEEHPGATELFRAHEVAHEWWGHKIGWKTYRDQWLSESFAEYSSMMFVQATVKGGEQYYDEIINAYDGIVQGNLAGGFSKFNRPGLIEFNAAARARIGPIGVGYRAGTSDVPAGYEIQAYYKGPLVLHMLRSVLRFKSHNDDLFVKILRDFVKEYSGKDASTADFQRMVEKETQSNWSFFFDAWVYDSTIPTIRWSYKVETNATGGAKLTVNVKRSEARDDFMIVAPIRLEFDGNRAGTIFMPIRKNEETMSQDLPAAPKKVIFAPEHSLLANIRRE